MRLHFNLTFPEPLESDFQADYASKTLTSARFGLFLGALFYALFGWLDPWALPVTWRTALWVRFAFEVPLLLLALTISFVATEWFKKCMQPLLTAVIVLGASGITVMLVASRDTEAGYFAYVGGHTLALMFTYALLRLRFFYTAISATLILGSYMAVAFLVQRMSTDMPPPLAVPIFIANSVILASAVIVAIVASYTLEAYARSDFEHRLKIEQETERLTRALDELQRTQAQLVQSERMAGLGTLVAGLVHEIASPVGTIRSNSDLATRALERLESLTDEAEETETDGQSRMLYRTLAEALRGNESASGRVRLLLDSLRTFTHLDRAPLSRANVNDGLESTLVLLGPELERRITVVRELSEIPVITCFPGELNQVFMHLLRNAAQAISGFGTITVRSWSDEKRIYVQVEDTGRGIDPEQVRTIFIPALTQHGTRVRAGLGLFVSHQIVERHHGKIDIRGEPGRGTAVTLELPTDLEQRLKRKPQPQPQPPQVTNDAQAS